MKFLFLEPFFGGSHRDFAEGLAAHSTHEIELVTLPARFWKWRMRGAALHLAQKLRPLPAYDGLITTDLMSLSDFRTLMGPACPEALVYFHENQITYPPAPGEQRDVHFGFTDITTALAAKRVLFNSRTHFDAFFAALPEFLGLMPEFKPYWVVDAIRDKSGFLYPGCRFPCHVDLAPKPSQAEGGPPLIIWNHRWEFDKNPGDFFSALAALSRQGKEFRVALLGENFQTVPKEFIAARQRLDDRIVQYGYVRSKEEYRCRLQEGDIVISTADQENFGISIVEAVRYGCMPLLPDRLSYPEIIPDRFHPHCLYHGQKDLVDRLADMIDRPETYRAIAPALADAMARYSWDRMIDRYDRELSNLTM